MSSLRVAQDISKDGKRKAVIKEINASSCKIELYYGDFCVMDIVTSENTLDLDKKKVSNRRYIQFADEFLESGFNGRSLSNVVSFINSGRRRQSKCDVQFYFANALRVDVCGYVIDYQINIGDRYIKARFSSNNYSYDKLASMSINELLELSSSWDVLSYKYGGYDGIGNRLCYFEYNGYTFYGYRDMLDGMQRTEYLKRIDFLKTKSVLKLDNIPDEMKTELAMSKMLGLNKKLMILYFNEDATPLIKVL